MAVIDEAFTRTEAWTPEAGAATEALVQLQTDAALELPTEYVEFLRRSNGGEGEFGTEPGWFQIWPAEEVIQYNREYEVQRWLPGFFAFGSSGGGMLFVFDTRSGEPWRVLAVDSVGMEDLENAIEIGLSFASFLACVGTVWENNG